ncbi:hypothetical protein BKA82DRAFT_25782, partial [Pisolithus tinctorius]
MAEQSPRGVRFNPGVRIRRIEARGDNPGTADPSRNDRSRRRHQRPASYGEKTMQDPVPPPPPPSAAAYSKDHLVPPPPPPFETAFPMEELLPPPPPPSDTAEVAAEPEEVPPPPPPAEDIEDEDTDRPPPPPSSDDDESADDLTPPPPPSSEDYSMSDEPIPPPPPPADESDSRGSIASPDAMETEVASAELLPAEAEDTRFLAAAVATPQHPSPEDQPDVFAHTERNRLRRTFQDLCSAWIGHDLSDEEKTQMEMDGFVHPGADVAVYWEIHRLRLDRRPVRYHFPFVPHEWRDRAIADGMSRTATEFAYSVARRMDLLEEGDRCLGQLDDLEEFHDPFISLGLQRYAGQPRNLARNSVMDMIVMYMACRINTAVRHLTQLPSTAHWPEDWYQHLRIDMGTLDCLIPIAVTQNCYRPPLPAAYILHHMGGWTEATFRDALFQIPEAQITDFTYSIIELLPRWSLHPDTDGGFVLPWWLNGISNYASEARVLRSDEIQTIAQRYFTDLWPLQKSPIKDRLHGVLDAQVKRYKNNALRVEALLPGLTAEVEELFERLNCMAQMLGRYREPNACI